VHRCVGALGFLCAAALVAFGASPSQAATKPSVKFGSNGQIITMCFTGAERPKSGFPRFVLPLTVNTWNRHDGVPGRVARTHNFNLSQAARGFSNPGYGLIVTSAKKPCVKIVMRKYASDFSGDIEIRIKSKGRPVGRAVYAYTNDGTEAQRIWHGTDAFVNYCINKNRLIRSSGGRLYCTREATATFRLKRIA